MPAQHLSSGHLNTLRELHPVEARRAGVVHEVPRLAGRITLNKSVVHDLVVAGMKFDGFDVPAFSRRHLDDKVAINILAIRREPVG